MLATARLISEKGGTFPDTPDELRKLKGIGPHSQCHRIVCIRLSGCGGGRNVYRILSRVFGVAESPDLPEGKKRFATLADDVLDRKRPAAFNQAMMDLGSLVCTPVKPDCDHCPWPVSVMPGSRKCRLLFRCGKNEPNAVNGTTII